MGAATFANSLDHSDLRFDIKQAIRDHDEVALSSAIDVARELGFDYEYQHELNKAESILYEMLQCPDESPK